MTERRGRKGGEERRREALAAAIALLSREGRASFSMRGVATEARMSLGHLQHYFPTEAALLDAIFDDVMARSLARLEGELAAVRDAGKAGDRAAFATLVERLLESYRDREMGRLFLELWALGARRPSARAALARFYARYRTAVAALLPAGGRSRERRAAALVALLEGSALFALDLAGSFGHADVTAFRDAALAIAGHRSPTRTSRDRVRPSCTS